MDQNGSDLYYEGVVLLLLKSLDMLACPLCLFHLQGIFRFHRRIEVFEVLLRIWRRELLQNCSEVITVNRVTLSELLRQN